MFQSTALQDHVTGRENLRMFASFYRRTLPLVELIEACALASSWTATLASCPAASDNGCCWPSPW